MSDRKSSIEEREKLIFLRNRNPATLETTEALLPGEDTSLSVWCFVVLVFVVSLSSTTKEFPDKTGVVFVLMDRWFNVKKEVL